MTAFSREAQAGGGRAFGKEVCVRTCMHVMCAIPEATTVTVSKNITLS